MVNLSLGVITGHIKAFIGFDMSLFVLLHLSFVPLTGKQLEIAGAIAIMKNTGGTL